jgi:hypothetical protein
LKKKPPKKTKCPKNLDCDFSKNGTACRWHNLEGDGGGSVKDIFVETHARPKSANWSKIVGNNDKPVPPYGIILTQRSTLKTGILFASDPIPEQPGQGKLFLKYWLSPFVTLKACVRTTKRPNFISCSRELTRGPSSNGVLDIKGPIKKEFQIVIEIGNFKSKKGHLAIIDDIRYESDLCKGKKPKEDNNPKPQEQAPPPNEPGEDSAQNQQQDNPQPQENDDSGGTGQGQQPEDQQNEDPTLDEPNDQAQDDSAEAGGSDEAVAQDDDPEEE